MRGGKKKKTKRNAPTCKLSQAQVSHTMGRDSMRHGNSHLRDRCVQRIRKSSSLRLSRLTHLEKRPAGALELFRVNHAQPSCDRSMRRFQKTSLHDVPGTNSPRPQATANRAAIRNKTFMPFLFVRKLRIAVRAGRRNVFESFVWKESCCNNYLYIFLDATSTAKRR